MVIEEADVRRIVESVWSTTLGCGLTALDVIRSDRGEPVLTAFVLIAGAWEGAVMIQCSATLARRCASLMFETPTEDITPEEIDDALGELANMVGGNVKNLVVGPSTLSLPAVVEGRDHSVHVPGSHVLWRVAFDAEGAEVLVSVLERTPAGRAAQA